MNPLKPNDKVFIQSLGMSAKVLRVRDVETLEEKSIYEVQITRCFRRADLELDDREAKAAERRNAIADKMARLEDARKRLEEAMDGPETRKVAAAIEYFTASDNAWKEFGHAAILEPIK